MRASPILPALAIALFGGADAAGDINESPEWLNILAHLPTPAYAGKAPAIVLLDEDTIEIDAHGVATDTHRFAVRILHFNGRENANGGAYYNGAADKVLTAEAWLVRNGRIEKPVAKSDWVDIAAKSPGAAIDELRSRQINLSERALANDVFGCETNSSSSSASSSAR